MIANMKNHGQIMTFRYRYVFPLLLTLLISLSACITFTHCSDDTPTQPPDTLKPPDSTSHKFVWEVDTLFYEGTTNPVYLDAKAIYGTSATNLYLAGYSMDGRTQSWHWDGRRWKVFNTYGRVGSIIDIDGIDSSFIVLLGDEKGSHTANEPNMVIWNNLSYGSMAVPLGNRRRTCIHVVSRNEIYLGRVDGIQRYNGSTWEWMLDTSRSLDDSYGYEFHPEYICKLPDGNLEFVSKRGRSLEQLKFYRWRYSETRFTVIDTFSYDQKDISKINFGYSLSRAGNEFFSASIGGIYCYKSGVWDKIHIKPSIHITGTENDLFYASNWGSFQHYNGNTWKDLYPIILQLQPDIRLIQGVNFVDGVIFLVGTTSNYFFVVRGRQLTHT